MVDLLSQASPAGLVAKPTPRIEDHALIGDMRTAALVTKEGSIDWLCLPAFDSDACFAALVGNAENGHWTISPTVPVIEVRRSYRKNTLILETDFVTESGTVRLIDFMPPRRRREHSQVCRSVRCLRGRVPMRSQVSPRLAFGRAVPRVLPISGALKLFAGPDSLYLRGGPSNGSPSLVTEFLISQGHEVSYSLTYGASYDEPARAEGIAYSERTTERYWTRWCSKIHAPALYRDLVIRSLITIKACIYAPSGGIVAAPTSSLPETPGGMRNWDYRYCWLRDGALSLRSLIIAGLREEAQAFFEWMLRAIAGDPAQIQIMYGIRGERRLSEVELPWLDGYEGARPVRVGNAAYDQRQLDVYGELAMVLYDASKRFNVHRPEAVRASSISRVTWPMYGSNQTAGSGRCGAPSAPSPRPRSQRGPRWIGQSDTWKNTASMKPLTTCAMCGRRFMTRCAERDSTPISIRSPSTMEEQGWMPAFSLYR